MSAEEQIPLAVNALNRRVADLERIAQRISTGSRGVLGRSFYNAGDQSVTPAMGEIAVAGSPVLATVKADRYTRLHTQAAVFATSLASFRVTHYWNGTAVWVSQLELENGITNVVDFASAPLGLLAVTGNYAITCQAFTNTVTIQHSTFQPTFFWVEDHGTT